MEGMITIDETFDTTSTSSGNAVGIKRSFSEFKVSN
jgi:hypothetical protein